jgi:hypothetical protein
MRLCLLITSYKGPIFHPQDLCEGVETGTEEFREKLVQCYLFPHKSDLNWPRCKPGPRQWEAGEIQR